MANNVTDLGKVGITLKGEWSSATNYERLDAVTYEGSLYIAIKDSSNVNPGSNPAYWMLSAKHGEFTEQQLEDFKAEVVAESKEEMDDYTDEKKAELDTYEENKETELNSYTSELKADFDSNATTKITAFNTNAEAKTTEFNINATNKTTDFNTNAANKTTAFDNNATSKTSDFDTNASTKTTAFDSNASLKTSDFNDNATAKTTAFDEHVDDKIDEFDENADEIQQEVDELSANMPWATTEQATEITVNDAARYSRNKLELFGNTELDSYQGYNVFSFDYLANNTATNAGITFSADVQNETFSIEGTATSGAINAYLIGTYTATSPIIKLDAGEYTFFSSNFDITFYSYDGISRETIHTGKNGVLVTIPEGFRGLTAMKPKNLTEGNYYNSTTKLMILKGNYVNNIPAYEPYVGGVPSPNPDYPQDIHVVTGENTIHTGRFNNGEFALGAYNNLNNKSRVRYTNSIIPVGTKITIQMDIDLTKYKWAVYESTTTLPVQTQISVGSGWITNSKTFTYTTGNKYVNLNIAKFDNSEFSESELINFAVNFIADYHKEYPLNLGDIELCKIGDYHDAIFKNTPDNEYYDSSLVENGWYKYGRIRKYIGADNVNFANNRIILKSRSKLRMESSTNEFTQGLANASTSITANLRYNYGWNGLAFALSANEVEMIGAGNTEEFKAWCDENLISYAVINPTYDDIDITQITDTTLISQLEAIYNSTKLTKGINHITVTPQDLAPEMKLTYMQDLKSKLDNIDSRLALLE